MVMDEDTKVLRDYLMFTVPPHVTVLAGALLGVLLIAGVSVNTALGIFTSFYGSCSSFSASSWPPLISPKCPCIRS